MIAIKFNSMSIWLLYYFANVEMVGLFCKFMRFSSFLSISMCVSPCMYVSGVLIVSLLLQLKILFTRVDATEIQEKLIMKQEGKSAILCHLIACYC